MRRAGRQCLCCTVKLLLPASCNKQKYFYTGEMHTAPHPAVAIHCQYTIHGPIDEQRQQAQSERIVVGQTLSERVSIKPRRNCYRILTMANTTHVFFVCGRIQVEFCCGVSENAIAKVQTAFFNLSFTARNQYLADMGHNFVIIFSWSILEKTIRYVINSFNDGYFFAYTSREGYSYLQLAGNWSVVA